MKKSETARDSERQRERETGRDRDGEILHEQVKERDWF